MRCAVPPYRGPAQRAAGLPPKASAGRADDGAIVLGVVEIAAIIAISHDKAATPTRKTSDIHHSERACGKSEDAAYEVIE